ncbi:tigger transposable element derived 5-like [Chelonus insularis]|uniref:tigger transposable element derived 5-like n=1 Tax=Chelonus insularis TaxID=460826 RepID=UPI00158EE20F|nr:tigger transposable element derived 5-like [Chelonus insularis]
MSCDSSLKRKHNEVSIEVKLRAIREIEKGSSIYDICNELKVHHNTVKSWLKNKEKFVKWSAERGNNKLMPRRRLSHEDNKNVNHAMWIWFQDKRQAGVPINGPMIQAQALRFNSIFGGNEDFKASNGWLRSWKERHGIRALTICGEKLSANIEATDPFKEKFLKLCSLQSREIEFSFSLYCKLVGELL